MKIAKVLALLGLLAMTGILIYGFTVGNFSAEGAKLVALPWGIVKDTLPTPSFRGMAKE